MDLSKFQKAISCGLLSDDLCDIVDPPKLSEIESHCAQINLRISPEHKDLLIVYGGSNLDIIRINGLLDLRVSGNHIEFARDYSGFIYKYSESWRVFVEDTDGGAEKEVASSIEHLINNVLLGSESGCFLGNDWLEELREHGFA